MGRINKDRRYNCASYIRRSRLGRYIKAVSHRWIPKTVYVKIAPRVLPLLNSERRSHGVCVEIWDSKICRVRYSNDDWWFVGAYRADLYIYKDGIETAKRKMREKYLLSDWTVSSEGIVIDIGANVGEFSAAMADIGCKIIAFEPEPAAAECLERNLRRYAGVTLVNKAVGNTDGHAVFFSSPETADSSCLRQAVSDGELRVPVVRLDTWMKLNNCGYVELVKVEAEGFEPEVLEGMSGVVSRIGRVAVDAGPERYGESPIKMATEILERYGFNVSVVGYQVYGEK